MSQKKIDDQRRRLIANKMLGLLKSKENLDIEMKFVPQVRVNSIGSFDVQYYEGTINIDEVFSEVLQSDENKLDVIHILKYNEAGHYLSYLLLENVSEIVDEFDAPIALNFSEWVLINDEKYFDQIINFLQANEKLCSKLRFEFEIEGNYGFETFDKVIERLNGIQQYVPICIQEVGKPASKNHKDPYSLWDLISEVHIDEIKMCADYTKKKVESYKEQTSEYKRNNKILQNRVSANFIQRHADTLRPVNPDVEITLTRVSNKEDARLLSEMGMMSQQGHAFLMKKLYSKRLGVSNSF